MSIKLPEVLKAFAAIIDSRGYAGRADELVLPKLTRKMEEYRGAGMDRPVKIDMGGEALTSELTLSEYSPDVLKQWGLTTVDGLSVRFKGSVKADDQEGDEIPVEVVMKGRFSEMDQGTWKSSEAQTMKLMVEIAEYKFIRNGETLIWIDVLGGIEEVGGVDRLAARRANITP